MKLQHKLLLAPAVVVGFLVVFGIVMLQAMRMQRAAVEELSAVVVDFSVMARVTRTLDETHGKVYRLITWSTNLSADRYQTATKDIVAGLERLDASIAEIAKSPGLEPGERKAVEEAKAELQKYRKHVLQAVDLASTDAAMGVSMMQSADESYQKIDERFEGLVKQHAQDAEAASAGARGLFGKALATGAFVLAGAIALGIGISLVLGRRIMKPLREAGDVAARIAAGDLTAKVDAHGKDEVAELLRSLERMRGALTDMIGSIGASADRVSAATHTLAGSAERAASASQQQSDNASSMAAAVEELTVSVNQMAENARQAHELSVDSGEVSRKGGEVIRRTLDEMKGIDASVTEAAATVSQLGQQSARISHVVGVIKEIADQTNLLALNAAIEAARAGEQGRGFAVVADEVRKLAERTTQSTEEIRQMVTRIQGDAQNAVAGIDKAVAAVKSGVSLAESAGESTRQITERAEAMVREVAAISAALKEQGAAGNDIATSVEKIVRMTDETSSAAGSAASLAKDLQGLAETMHAQVGRFKV